MRIQNNIKDRGKVVVFICTMLFCLNVFAGGISAEACCKGSHMPRCLCRGVQHQAPVMSIAAPFDSCCSHTQYSSCRLSNSQPSSEQEFNYLIVRIRPQTSVESLALVEENFPEIYFQNDSASQLYIGMTSRSTPIYIQHQAFLC